MKVDESFLKSVLSLSLAEVRSEPQRLKAEHEDLQARKQYLAESNFQSFIHYSAAMHESVALFGRAEKSLRHIPPLLDGVESSLHNFCNRERSYRPAQIGAVEAERRETEAYDILELPRLIETCIAAELYEEALAGHRAARRWVRAHPDVALFQQVCTQAEEAIERLVVALEHSLEGEPSLAECLQVVDLLRRTGHYEQKHATEGGFSAAVRLRVRFLALREVSLQLRDPSWYIQTTPKSLRSSESYRMHVLQVAAHYRAAFGDDESAGPSVAANGPFARWAMAAVDRYCAGVEQVLDRVDSAAEFALWVDQVTYVSRSLASLGLDFWPAVAGLFDRCLETLLERQLGSAAVRFQFLLRVERWISAGPAELPSAEESSESEFDPPPALVRFAALGHATNAVLTVLNDLQRCLPLHLVCMVARRLERFGSEIVASVAALRSEFLADSGQPLRRAGFEAFVRDMRDLLFPYLEKCVLRCLGPHQPRFRLDSASDALSAILDLTAKDAGSLVAATSPVSSS